MTRLTSSDPRRSPSKGGGKKKEARPPAFTRKTNQGLDQLLSNLRQNGKWLDLKQFQQIKSFFEVLTNHEPWRSHLTFFDLYDILAKTVRRHSQVETEAPTKIVDLLDAQHFQLLRTDLHNYLLSLPRKYELWVQLPGMPRWGEGATRLTERLEMVERKESKPDGIGLVTLASLGRLGFGNVQGESAVYLCAHCSGYGDARLDTTAAADGVSQIKQFFQMFRRRAIYKETSQLAHYLSEARISCFLVDPKYPDDQMDVRLPARLSKFLAAASIADEKLEYFDINMPGTFLGGKTLRKPQNREEYGTALLTDITWITRLMNCPSSSWPDADRIRSAFEWAFDSEENDNQTLAFIQAFIGLEALLGDEDKDEPLVSRLADRCAYLLGESLRDREGIRKRFRAMYSVRSKLVHGRTPRLSLSDARELSYAQTLLGDVITAEAERLLRALSKQETKK